MLTVITLKEMEDMWTRFWKTNAPLTLTAGLMVVVMVASVIGLAMDPRIITGAPAWLKPAKFAVSIAIYALTLAWIFSLIPQFARTRRIVGWTTAVTLVLEIVLICVQAFRGTTSHFNIGTPFDAAVFAMMGIAIVVQTISAVAVAVALWRHSFADAALGWALRLGMVITIAGASTGGLMTRPTSLQLDAARAGGRMAVAGAHTVGAPDGGPGLPGTGWSTTHGDVRVPHFVGLHAIQVLPVVALLLARRGVRERVRLRLTLTAAASYVTLFAILLSQALRGHPVLAPDALTLMLLATWFSATGAAPWFFLGTRSTTAFMGLRRVDVS
jgi:hypothetical protein